MIPEIKYKQFVIVPKRPKMSPGKIASQVAHATFMALYNQKTKPHGSQLLTDWKNNGMCVIVLECKHPGQLMGIAKYLEQWKIPHHLYIDEGLTEVSAFTPTCLSTGVLSEKEFWIFQQMKLYK